MTAALFARPAPPASEKDFQAAVVGLARVCGWKVMHSRPAMDRRGRWSTPLQGDKGFPDLVLCGTGPRAGRLILAELKDEAGRLSEAQEEWLEVLNATSAEVYFWRPRDMPTIGRILEMRAV